MTNRNKRKFEKKIVSKFKNEKTLYSDKELKKILKVSKHNFPDFQNAINSLRASGLLIKHKMSKKYYLRKRVNIVTGELKITKGGFGFVNDKERNVDIYISKDHLNTAFDQDIVEVKLYTRNRGKNEEGYITKIIKRFRTQFVGIFHKTDYYGYVVPENPKIYRDFYIPEAKQKNVQDGQKVVVALEKWQTDHLNPEGEIIEIIGFPGEVGVDVASVAHSYQLRLNFQDKIQKEVKEIKVNINKDDLINRVDLRDKICITIDPEDAKDFDDAVSLEKINDDTYQLGVHIADVSHYVKEHSSIDVEALERGTSVYLVDRVIPMLPEQLSNSICSLQAKEDKLTLSCIMNISKKGEVVQYKIVPSIINSKKRFTYEEVQEIIESKPQNQFYTLLRDMIGLSKILTKKRLKEGGIDFETPEISFDLDDNGFPIKIKRKVRLDSHRLIEEFMLMANKSVAQYLSAAIGKNELKKVIYRIHEKPERDKLDKFFEFLKALDLKVDSSKRVSAKFFQKLFKDIKGTKEEILIEEVALRTMMKAVYSTNNVGHFGLGFKEYTHFTSPIRRYPDLIVHRLIKKYNDKHENLSELQNQLPKICEHTTIREKNALEAERDSIRLKQNEYISKRIGEEFTGIISGVVSFGIFIELIDTLVEGLIHIKDLNDYYIYDERTYSLTGRDTNHILRLGDEVKIRVANVNLDLAKVEFELVGDEK